jgi:hypothetical protein
MQIAAIQVVNMTIANVEKNSSLLVIDNQGNCISLDFADCSRVTMRPGFPGHVLFLWPCPGVRAAFQKYGFCPGFSP